MPSWKILDKNAFYGEGALTRLEEFLKGYHNALVFGDTIGYRLSGAAEYIGDLRARKSQIQINEILYSGKALPLKDIEKVFSEVKNFKSIDAIVAVGGGTVMDLAKIIAIAYTNGCDRVEEVLLQNHLENQIPLIFIPTTAGTGSEATTFAVVYREKTKISIDRESILARYVILDPLLLRSLPAEVLHATVLDALAQATESLWARGGTNQSREFASRAIPPILENINKENSLDRLGSLQRGSFWAGKAINISKTTLCHSISYPLTSYFGIPHGIAVFLTLPAVALLNYRGLQEELLKAEGALRDPEVFSLIFRYYRVENIAQLETRLKGIMAQLHIKTRLSDYGIAREDLPFISSHSITPGRSDNNPVDVSQDGVLKILEGIF